jgi:site-specific recombinase XerD
VPNPPRSPALAINFLAWRAGAGVTSITAVQRLHVAAWVELQTQRLSAPTVNQRLAAIRHLFDWLVTGQIVPHNAAASVPGTEPHHSKAKPRCSMPARRGSCSTALM